MTQEEHELLVRIDERVGVLTEGHKNQERRIRGLERVRNWAYGAMAASGMGYSFMKYLPAIPL